MRSAMSIGEMLRMRDQIAIVSADAPVYQVVEVMVEAGVEGVLVVNARGRVVGSVGDEQLVAKADAPRALAAAADALCEPWQARSKHGNMLVSIFGHP